MKSTSAQSTRKRSPLSAKPWTPLSIQKRGLKFLVEHGAAALLFDPGVGKTSTVLAAFSWLLKRKVARRMLVIAPLRVCYLVWPQEILDWLDFNHLRIGILHGKNKDAVLANVENYDVLVINPEGLDWLLGKRTAHAFKKFGIDTLVVDELTKFKHSKGRRFKLLRGVLDTFSRRWGLTGTPAPNGLLDLFGQMYILDQGRSLGRYITHYRTEYFTSLDPMGWKWIPQKGAEERIYERLRPLALRAKAEDYIDLPEIVPMRVWVELPPAARQAYDAIEEDLIAKLEGADKRIVALTQAAASTKLRQIANGAVYIDDDVASLVKGKRRTVQPMHDAKLDALEELVDELQGQPLFCAYEFNHDLDRLLVRFPDTPVLGGDIKLLKGIENAWNAGDYPLLLGQPASVGHGLNLQRGAAAHVVWFSMFWDLELYDQFFRRIRRQGNKAKRVFNHHIMAKDTIDETVWWSQRAKDKTQQSLLDALKSRRG